MPTATGIITIAQETRFRLVTDEGKAKLLVLAADAPLEPQDLHDLERDQTRVTVRFTETEPLLAGIAHDLHIASRE